MVHDFEVEQEIHRIRQEDKQELFLLVLDRAEEYRDEIERADPAHKARLQKREQALQEAITFAYEAIQRRPVTNKEREHVRKIMEAAEKQRSINSST